MDIYLLDKYLCFSKNVMGTSTSKLYFRIKNMNHIDFSILSTYGLKINLLFETCRYINFISCGYSCCQVFKTGLVLFMLLTCFLTLYYYKCYMGMNSNDFLCLFFRKYFVIH